MGLGEKLKSRLDARAAQRDKQVADLTVQARDLSEQMLEIIFTAGDIYDLAEDTGEKFEYIYLEGIIERLYGSAERLARVKEPIIAKPSLDTGNSVFAYAVGVGADALVDGTLNTAPLDNKVHASGIPARRIPSNQSVKSS